MSDEEKLRTIAKQLLKIADRMATVNKMIEAAERLKASGVIDSDDLKVAKLGELLRLLRRYRAELAGIAERPERMLANVLPANDQSEVSDAGDTGRVDAGRVSVRAAKLS